MALFVGSVVFQLFEKALGRIFVICSKAAPVPVRVHGSARCEKRKEDC